MKKYLKNVLWLLFFVCVAAMAYINTDYEDFAPQRETRIETRSDVTTTSRTCFLLEN